MRSITSMSVALSLALGFATCEAGGNVNVQGDLVDTAASGLAAVASQTFTSTLYSAEADGTCADISQNDYLSLGMLECDSAPAQSFEFQPVKGAAGQFVITSVASGLCLQDYRSEVRQGSCSKKAVHRPYEVWTLRSVDASNQSWQVVQTLSNGYEQCMNATPTHSTPPYVLWLAACLEGNDVQSSGAQTFQIKGVPQ